MVCMNCGKLNDDSCKFCVYCGSEIEYTDFPEPKTEVPVKQTKNNKKWILFSVIGGLSLLVLILLFVLIGGCFDSSELDLNKQSVGEYIVFGTYEQDGNNSNGKENIEWLVLDVKDDKALVISKYALDCKPLNIFYKEMTWEQSSLRGWLNNDFYYLAFSEKEQQAIADTVVENDNHSKYGVSGGTDTNDKVFLLSVSEANQYFASDDNRKCKPSAFALYNEINEGNNCSWWLRTPGHSSHEFAIVDNHGSVNESGAYVNYDMSMVRPVMWINIK